jgi:membrane protease YdiL (CAAX protease family)
VSIAAGQDPADRGTGTADPAPGTPVGPEPGAAPTEGAPVSPVQGSAAIAPPPGPAAWDPPAPPFGTVPAGQVAAPTAGVGTTPPPGGGAVGPPGYAPGQPYPLPYPPGQYAPVHYPQGPYPQGPYPPAGPYPAPSIGRTPRRGPSWGAPAPTRTHRWGLGAYLLAEAVFLLVSGGIGVFLIGDGGPTVGTLILALAVPTLLAASTALLITRVRGNGPRIDLGLVWSWRDLGIGLAFGLGGLALTIPASIVYVAIVGEDATSAVGDVFGGIRAGPALAVLVLVIVVFIAPTCEEILYRGLLWGGIEKLAGRWVAFAVSTLLFAIAHFEFTRTPLLLVVAVPIAIARLYTGRLLASIVAHQINNLLPGIALVLGLLGVVPMA